MTRAMRKATLSLETCKSHRQNRRSIRGIRCRSMQTAGKGELSEVKVFKVAAKSRVRRSQCPQTFSSLLVGRAVCDRLNTNS